MKIKFKKQVLSLVAMLLMVCLWGTPVFAGQGVQQGALSSDSKSLDDAVWHNSSDSVTYADGQLVIPAKDSDEYTKLICKNIAKVEDGQSSIIKVLSSLKLTDLPRGEEFVMAFGLPSIEATQGEAGNVELIFTRKNEVKLSIIAYNDSDAVTLVKETSCGVAMNQEFTIDVEITKDSTLIVKINNSQVCNKKLPVSGEGRFGILQTGSCGAIITKLDVTCYRYERPENVNIVEDFEDGEFDASVLVASATSTSVIGCYMRIEEYNGSKVLMFSNLVDGIFGTLCSYSNFEVSFDIPRLVHEDIYDANGKIARKTPAVYLGFGEPTAFPMHTAGYGDDIDVLAFSATSAESFLRKTWKQSYEELGVDLCGDLTKNQGYSVKVTMIDGDMVVKAKPLTGSKWITITEQHYDEFRSGYIYIRAIGTAASFAIDNFKITNMDSNPSLIETEYVSSIMELKDYALIDVEEELVFREGADKKDNEQDEEKTWNVDTGTLLVVGGSTVALLALIGVIVFLNVKKKKKNGGIPHETE